MNTPHNGYWSKVATLEASATDQGDFYFGYQQIKDLHINEDK
ncbi:MAG: hypothetical protein ACXVCE_14670 [Bacteriovorax sp.]